MARRFGLVAALALAMTACSPAASAVPTQTVASPGQSIAATPSASASSELDADVDVGGRTMHLECVGPTDTDEPTILLEAGLGAPYFTWAEILSGMQSSHRLCAYDRAGLGQSEPPAEASRTAADQVTDLRALLDGAGVNGPFVIAAHSYGPMVATLYTHAYPADVVGLLFVDPRGPHVSAGWRDALPAPTADEPGIVTDLRDFIRRFETEPLLNPEHIHLRASYAEVAAALDPPAPLFGDRPVVVLSAEVTPAEELGLPPDLAKTVDEILFAAHWELAEESTAGSLATVAGAGHQIQVDQPQAVIDALERILRDLATSLRPATASEAAARAGEWRRNRKALGAIRGPVSCLESGGARGIRTPDLLNAIQTLSQLSYSPTPERGV
jgi:pimeloyl-ACP methyl ester carboxylesterase